VVVLGAGLIFWRRRWRRAGQRQAASTVPFYTRLLRLLEQLALRPRPAQTPEEFVVAATGTLAPRLGPVDLTDGLLRVVRAFYAVRFGGHDLDPAQMDQVTRDLDRLEEALASAKSKG
jgi:hypothetical protein